jgi:anti-sigma factor RsiW
MASNELACNQFVELVTEYLEGSLSTEERTRFEAHLAACQGCETYLEQMEQTIRWTGKLTEEQIAAEAKEKLLQAFRDWNSTR